MSLLLPKEVRLRSERHLKFVARFHYCVACRRTQPSVAIHAHHLMFAQPRAKSLKSGDNFTVPLCVECHADLHADGDEEGWWKRRVEFDPIVVAETFWKIGPEKGRGE